jgi:hypothetical protein
LNETNEENTDGKPMDLQFYLLHATAEQKPVLQEQWKQATTTNAVTCPCGQARALCKAFKCLYCGIWFCAVCAEVHFGKTVQQWVTDKRVALRAEIEQRRLRECARAKS